MDKLRFGIVGVGMMGCEHIRNLKLHPEAEIVALMDPVEDSLGRGLQQLGADASTYDNLAEMLEMEAPDAVIVSSPNYLHREALEELLGLPDLAILCEKPLCTTLEDARWAAGWAARHPGVFWTGMEYRFMPPAARFIEAVHGGQVGRLVQLSIREHRFPFLVKVGDWNRFSRNTGGTMVEKCCHFFDLMRLIVQARPVSVFCSGAMDVNHRDERYGGQTPDIIDNAFTIVDFENGVRAMLDLCMFAEGSEEQEALTAVGDEAKLECFIPSGDLVRSPRTPLGQAKTPERIHVPVDEAVLAAGTHHGATYYQIAAFIDAVRGRGPVQVSAEDGFWAVAMGVAAEISAREKRVVTMAELGL